MTRPAPVSAMRPLLRKSGDSWYDHKANTIWIGDADQAIRGRVATHELSHFLLHASTPYGWLLDEISQAQNNQVLQYCLTHAKRAPLLPILVPLYELAEEAGSHPPLKGMFLPELCERFVIPWSHTIFLENLLEGEAFPEVTSAKQDQALHTLEMVESYLEEMEKGVGEIAPFDAEYVLEAVQYDAVQEASWAAESTFPLGAKHVFEGLAKQLERTKVTKAEMTGGSRPYYWVLWASTARAFGFDAVQSKEDFERLTWTFYTLCDLSLFVPAGRLYGRLRGEHTSWFDIQPGWRFHRALAEARKLGWVNDLHTGMLGYQESICKQLGWPSPRRFIEMGAALAEDTFESRRYAEACKLRLEDHAAFIEIDQQVQEQGYQNQLRFLVNHTPMMYRSYRSQLEVPNSNGAAQQPLHLLLNWFFAQFNFGIMKLGLETWDDLLPASVEYQGVFKDISDRRSFLRFLQKSVPVLTSDKFQDISMFLAEAGG